MASVCENSLYNICACKTKYHLPLSLPLYDGHCHADLFFKYGLDQNDFNSQLAYGRKMVLIDNRHQHYRWFANYTIENPNVKTYTTYGVHPKYLPSDPQCVFRELDNIFKNKFDLNRTTVGIGECGLDETSESSDGLQLLIFKHQLKLATELKLPVVLHARGKNSFEKILRELILYLDSTHKIHWHCINLKSNLAVISDFLNYFTNSFIGLNGSIITSEDKDTRKNFNNWLLTQENILDRIVLETDFPFLRPSTLEATHYNPISGIVTVAQHIVNILRIKRLNTTKLIDRSNNNIRKMYGID